MENKAIRNEIVKDVKGVLNSFGGGAREARDASIKAKDQTKTGGIHLLDGAKEFFDSHTPDYVREGLATAQATAKRALETSEQVMRRNVWYTVLGAAGAGVLVGAWMFRRKH